MKILTLQGTPAQIQNLLNLMSDYPVVSLPSINRCNASERQLKDVLKSYKGEVIKLSLRPQGLCNIISTAPINLCTVKVQNNEYQFGGISEGFYDKMVERFHSE